MSVDPAKEDASTPPVTSDVFKTGKYAVLVRFFGNATTAGSGSFAEEFVMLADVARVNNGLQMSWKTCAYNGQALVPLFPPLDYGGVDVSNFPERTLQLVLNGNTFSTLGNPSLIGYEELTNCPAGSTQSHPERPWLAGGTCQCPTSSLLPTLPNDCRVTDIDGDGLPGFTVGWKGGTENRSYSRIKDSSQLVNGLIAQNGEHRANLLPSYENYQLGCDREPCSRYPVQVCAPEKNPARFLPLEDKEWSCADVVKEVENRGDLGLGQLMGTGC
ncbi:MAG TPA: hypothetical protein VFX59_18095 [Polyangiales bacterium]|nr:hypothetical protein [Polyangiales bacterium]